MSGLPSRLRGFFAEFSGLNRDARILIVYNFLSGVGYSLVIMIFQLYLKSVGYDGTTIGSMLMITGIVSGVSLIPSGLAADRYGRKKILVLGTILFFVSLFLLLSSTGILAITLFSVLSGLGQSFSWPIYSPFFAEKLEDGRMEAGFSISSFFHSASWALGSALGWIPELLFTVHGYTVPSAYRMAILISMAFSSSALIPILLTSEYPRGLQPRTSLKLKSKRVAMKFVLVTGLISFGAGLAIQLFTYYSNVKFDVGSGPIGTLYFLCGILTSPAYLIAPKLSSRIGVLKTIVYTQLVSVPLLLSISLSQSFFPAAIFYITRTVMMNMSEPLTTSLQMELVEEEERATVNSLIVLGWIVPNSIGSALGGYMMDVIWIELPIYATSIIYAAYSIIFYQLFKREVKEMQNTKKL